MIEVAPTRFNGSIDRTGLCQRGNNSEQNRTDIIHHWEIPSRLASQTELLNKYLYIEDPPINFHPSMKLITWNCQGARKLAFPVHCLGLKPSPCHSFNGNKKCLTIELRELLSLLVLQTTS